MKLRIGIPTLRFLTGLMIVTVSVLTFAGPAALTVQGRLVKDGLAVETASVPVTVRVTSTAIAGTRPECVLFEEIHTLNLTSSGGEFSFTIGSGTRTSNDKSLSILNVFSNAPTAVPSLACSGTPSATSYTPLATDTRNIYLTFADGADTIAFNPYKIQSVPYAIEAERLSGKAATDFLQVTTDTTQSKLNDIMNSTNYTELFNLINGTSNSFVRLSSGNINMSAGKFYVDSTAGKVGIGTSNPSSDLSFGGNAARTIAMERPTTADTAGNNLTVAAGGATSAATNKDGGSLLLASGTSTGTGGSAIQFQTSSAGTSGISSNSPTTKKTILPNGNVGIGTTSPSGLFDVEGGTAASGNGSDLTLQAQAGANSGGNGGSVLIASGSGGTTSGTGGAVNIQVGYSKYAGGNVNISSGSNDGVAGTAPGNVNLTAGTSLYHNAGNIVLTGGNANVNYNGGNIILSPGVTGGGTGTNGNVGIGTTAPAANLDVTANAAPSINLTTPSQGRFWILGGANGAGQFSSFAQANDAVLATASSGGNSIITNETGGNIVFGTGTTAANDSAKVTIAASGNVGIGTTSPTHALDVNGYGYFVSGILAGYGNVGSPGMSFGTSGFFSTDGSNIAVSAAGSEKMRILSNGNVGVGTTSPQATLDINGDIRLKKNSAAPVACYSTFDGRLALTSQYTTCVCKGTSSGWVKTIDGSTACNW